MAQPTDMFAAERKDSILKRIQRDGRVLASELAAEFQTSEDTIRRTLRELTALGHCQRVYGGALAIGSAAAPIAERVLEAGNRKAALGATLAKTLGKKQFVFIDGGTTNLAAARMIPENLGLTVATHDPSIAAALATRPDVTLIMVGGQVRPHLGSAVGVEATRQVLNLRPDVLLLGVCSLDARGGVSAFDAEDAAFKQILIENAQSAVAAALNEKLGVKAPFHICPVKRLTALVVEANAPGRTTRTLTQHGLRLTKADPPA